MAQHYRPLGWRRNGAPIWPVAGGSGEPEPEAQTEPEPEPQPDQPKPTETVDFWKAKAREQEKRAKDNATAAKRLAELEEAQKTEQQKSEERASAAERERDEARREALRLRVAVAKKLPPELADRLRGDSEDELVADADALVALIKAGKKAPPDDDAGTRTPEKGARKDAGVAEAAKRFGKTKAAAGT